MIRRSVTSYAGQSIVRYKLGLGFGWQIALHVVHAPNAGVWHDHYWDSWSLCLLGGLAEATDGGTRQIRPGRLRYRPCGQRHRVRGYAVTLILTSPRRHRARVWLEGSERAPSAVGGDA